MCARVCVCVTCARGCSSRVLKGAIRSRRACAVSSFGFGLACEDFDRQEAKWGERQCETGSLKFFWKQTLESSRKERERLFETKGKEFVEFLQRLNFIGEFWRKNKAASFLLT